MPSLGKGYVDGRTYNLPRQAFSAVERFWKDCRASPTVMPKLVLVLTTFENVGAQSLEFEAIQRSLLAHATNWVDHIAQRNIPEHDDTLVRDKLFAH